MVNLGHGIRMGPWRWKPASPKSSRNDRAVCEGNAIRSAVDAEQVVRERMKTKWVAARYGG